MYNDDDDDDDINTNTNTDSSLGAARSAWRAARLLSSQRVWGLYLHLRSSGPKIGPKIRPILVLTLWISGV